MAVTKPETLATLTFNTSATGKLFASERAKGLRLRIDRGVVSFRSVMRRRGDDIIAIDRLPRGVVANVHTAHRHFLQRLFKAGLSEEQPYFVIGTQESGWFSIEHYPFDHPPQKQPVFVVAGFEALPTAVDLPLWQRFRRALINERVINEALWQPLYKMILSADALTARPIRGRQSAERLNAKKLLIKVRGDMPRLVKLAARQPELAQMALELVGKITGEPAALILPMPDAVPNASNGAVTSVSREYVQQVLAEALPAPQYMRRTWQTIKPLDRPSVHVMPPPEPEPIDLPVAPTVRQRRRRTWPKIAPVELPEDHADTLADAQDQQVMQPDSD